MRSFFLALFACLLLALVCTIVHAHAAPIPVADPPESNVPLVQDILQRPLPADRLGRDTLAHALAMIGFKQHAASLRAFDTAQAIARLLGHPAPAAATVGDAIHALDNDPRLLPTQQHQLATDAIAIDFRTPLGATPISDDPTVPPPHGKPPSQVQYDLVGAALIQPGIWRAHDGARVDGQPLPDKFFIRGIANSKLASDALVDAMFALSGPDGTAPIRLSCDNQNVRANSTNPVYCNLRRSVTASIDDAAAVALLDSLQHGTAMLMPAEFVISTGSPRRTYWSTRSGQDVGPNDAEHNADFSAYMAAIAMLKQAGCTQMADCGARVGAVLRNPGYFEMALVLALMLFFVWRRWRSESVSAGTLAFARGVFVLYSVFVVITLILGVVDSPGGSLCKGGGVCGVLSALATTAASLPWSYLLLASRTALINASDHQAMAIAWVFIMINLAWLGFMAFCGPRTVDPRS